MERSNTPMQRFRMIHLICAHVLLVVLSAVVVNAAQHWSDYRGPTLNGHAVGENAPLHFSEQLNVAWKTPIQGKGWSSPVVWGEQIWLTTATPDGKEMFAVCVHRDTGKILFDVKLWDVEEPQPIHALNSYASPSPAVEAGRVYVHFGAHGTACLDTQTGEVLWRRRDLSCNHVNGPGGSPILYRDLLTFHMDGDDVQYVIALNKHNGKTAWKISRSTDFGDLPGDQRKAYYTPMIISVDHQDQLISPGAQALFGYHPLTGEELWTLRFKGYSGASRVTPDGGRVYLNTGFNKPQLWAVRLGGQGDVTETHVDWVLIKGVPARSSPVVVDGLIFMTSDGGVASCVDAKNGKQIWRHRLQGGEYSSSLIYLDGRIYFFSQEGRVTVIKPAREYEELAINHLDDGAMASPAVADDALFVRTRTHLYRIESAASPVAAAKAP